MDTTGRLIALALTVGIAATGTVQAAPAEPEVVTPHWSLQPIERPVPPNMSGDWVANPIDAFVLRELQRRGLSPSATADRRQLVRRLMLDVCGLPPTPEQLRANLAGSEPDAYGSLVERVLASSRYGERWARHWLDIVRFAETSGFEINRERPTAYHYRDYVIASLNEDTPYDEFVREQIAGDALGRDVGTGFLVAGPHDLVKSPDVNLTLMQRQDELADIVNATGTTFLGLTIGCARCHDHKFDPISQKDYFAVQAVFAGVLHGERPIRELMTEGYEQKLSALNEKAALAQAEVNMWTRRARRVVADVRARATGRPAVLAGQNEEQFPPVAARQIRFTIMQTVDGTEPCIDELEVICVDGQNIGQADAGAVPSASGSYSQSPLHDLAFVNDGTYGNSSSWISDAAGSGWVQIDLASPQIIDRIRWSRDRNGGYSDRVPLSYVIEVRADSGDPGPDDRSRATQPTGDWHVVADSRDRLPPDRDLAPAALISFLDNGDADLAHQAIADRATIEKQIAALHEMHVQKSWIGTFQQPSATKRLHRGDPLSPREVVAPDAISVLGTLDMHVDEPEQQRRLKLANWLTDPANPLTPRVIVNRLWQHHFGTGIVDTPSDFGSSGTGPSHPELLDWLASELIDNGWSLKHIHRLILMSNTYRQASRSRADCLAVDADSRLLWRYPPRRLEAEAIRDSILRVAGTLDLRMGGPGFSAFEVEYENVRHFFPRQEWGPEQWRRMIYMTKVRQEQDAVFGNFDCPDGNQTIPRRSRSTTPLQALNLLNSQFMMQQAELFAGRLQQEAGPAPATQVNLAFLVAYGRQPTTDESTDSVQLIEVHGLAAFCRAVLNTNEFLFLL